MIFKLSNTSTSTIIFIVPQNKRLHKATERPPAESPAPIAINGNGRRKEGLDYL